MGNTEDPSYPYPIEVKDEMRFKREMALDRQAYESLKDQLRRDYGQQYVAIAHGRFIGVAPTFDEATMMILGLQPQPEHFLVFQADDEPAFEIIEDHRIEFHDDFCEG